jgi:hypothetical protein
MKDETIDSQAQNAVDRETIPVTGNKRIFDKLREQKGGDDA